MRTLFLKIIFFLLSVSYVNAEEILLNCKFIKGEKAEREYGLTKTNNIKKDKDISFEIKNEKVVSLNGLDPAVIYKQDISKNKIKLTSYNLGDKDKGEIITWSYTLDRINGSLTYIRRIKSGDLPRYTLLSTKFYKCKKVKKLF